MIVGTRTSNLALWQTNFVIDRLRAAHPDIEIEIKTFVTKGDKTLDKPLPQIGGKGLFTLELENALRMGDIDFAVHSLKDLPVADPDGLTLGAILGRTHTGDALVARDGLTLDALPAGAVVGTSSPRRKWQLLKRRPDLNVRSVRGNVETRIRKGTESADYDAVILAEPGLHRLELEDVITERLAHLPAPGQGAIAVQCRADDAATRRVLEAIEDAELRACVNAEREFLSAMGGGCSSPIAALTRPVDGGFHFVATVLSSKKSVTRGGDSAEPAQLARDTARQILSAETDILTVADDTALLGKRVIVTRSSKQAGSFAARLRTMNATPVIFPVITFAPLPTEPLERAVDQIGEYDWLIFTSVNAVEFFVKSCQLSERRPKIAVVGAATVRALPDGMQPDFVPDEFTGEQLANGLPDITGKRILLPRAKRGRPEIVEMLRERGATVDDIALYDTVQATPTAACWTELLRGGDFLTFTSPSSVRNFVDLLEKREVELAQFEDARVVCIGPTTADEARQNGFRVDIVPEQYTIPGMIDMMEQFVDEQHIGN